LKYILKKFCQFFETEPMVV